jgi:hypothetical protein
LPPDAPLRAAVAPTKKAGFFGFIKNYIKFLMGAHMEKLRKKAAAPSKPKTAQLAVKPKTSKEDPTKRPANAEVPKADTKAKVPPKAEVPKADAKPLAAQQPLRMRAKPLRRQVAPGGERQARRPLPAQQA